MKLELVSRTIDTNQNRLVDELYVTFTHDIVMDWFLPGIQPTGKCDLPTSICVPSSNLVPGKWNQH